MQLNTKRLQALTQHLEDTGTVDAKEINETVLKLRNIATATEYVKAAAEELGDDGLLESYLLDLNGPTEDNTEEPDPVEAEEVEEVPAPVKKAVKKATKKAVKKASYFLVLPSGEAKPLDLIKEKGGRVMLAEPVATDVVELTLNGRRIRLDALLIPPSGTYEVEGRDYDAATLLAAIELAR